MDDRSPIEIAFNHAGASYLKRDERFSRFIEGLKGLIEEGRIPTLAAAESAAPESRGFCFRFAGDTYLVRHTSKLPMPRGTFAEGVVSVYRIDELGEPEFALLNTISFNASGVVAVSKAESFDMAYSAAQVFFALMAPVLVGPLIPAP